MGVQQISHWIGNELSGCYGDTGWRARRRWWIQLLSPVQAGDKHILGWRDQSRAGKGWVYLRLTEKTEFPRKNARQWWGRQAEWGSPQVSGKENCVMEPALAVRTALVFGRGPTDVLQTNCERGLKLELESSVFILMRQAFRNSTDLQIEEDLVFV